MPETNSGTMVADMPTTDDDPVGGLPDMEGCQHARRTG